MSRPRPPQPKISRRPGRRPRRIKVLTHPSLLVVDEIGYLPVTPEGAILFFRLINAAMNGCPRC